jgi:CDP-diacylglycerol--serine O-phosphatidyltransferase
VLRLARFNVEHDEDNPSKVFSGLPSPAAAVTIASFPVMLFGFKQLEYTDRGLLWVGGAGWFDSAAGVALPLITFAVACLMVSRVRYSHLVQHLVGGRRSGRHLIRLVFAVAVIFVFPQFSVPLLFCWYAFAPPLRALWFKRIARVKVNPQNRISTMNVNQEQ